MSAVRHLTASTAVAAALAALGTTVLVSATTSTAAPSAASFFGTPKTPATTISGDRMYLRPGDELVAGRPGVLNGTGLGVGANDVSYTQTGFTLQLGADGNLVEYQTGPTTRNVVWATGTSTGKRLIFQGDGNVVLYDGAGHALWQTGTAGTAAATFVAYGNGQLVVQDRTGHVLAAAGRAVVNLPAIVTLSASSPNGRFVLAVQGDGNLVAYDTTASPFRPIWNSRTAGAGPSRLVAQADGNLVLYQLSTGRPVWQTRTHGTPAYYQLDMQNDGNVVLYLTDGKRRVQALWATGTHA